MQMNSEITFEQVGAWIASKSIEFDPEGKYRGLAFEKGILMECLRTALIDDRSRAETLAEIQNIIEAGTVSDAGKSCARNESVVTYCGQPMKVACDRNCGKAWGISQRQKVFCSSDPDDFYFRADSELCKAPSDPGTYEYDHAKPLSPDEFPNKWCVRQCERCSKSAPGKHGEQIALKSFKDRVYNLA